MNDLTKAIQIATEAHDGQVDRAGQPYILHPLSVMLRLETIDEMIVGVLHDTIEDTDVTIESLHLAGFSTEVLDALAALTRGDETYETFILRAKENPLARQVKLADLAENMRLDRLSEVMPNDMVRQEKYSRAVAVLQS